MKKSSELCWFLHHPHALLWKGSPVVCCEKQSCVMVDWPLPKVPRDITLVAGGLLFLAAL